MFDHFLDTVESIHTQVLSIFAEDQQKLAHLPRQHHGAKAAPPARRKKIPHNRDHFET